MSAFLMLVWKEWRDARTTVAVAFVLAAAISFAFHQFLPRSVHGAWSATLGLELMPSLFATVLASDLVASDARGGRLLALRALPVAPLVAWAARVAWLAGATILFGAWCGAMQLAALQALGSSEAIGRFFTSASGSLHWLHLGLCVATGALFASTLGVGGVKAMLVGALVALPPVALVAQLAQRERLPVETQHLSLYALVLGLAFVAASALVFCRGRLHLGARWRPALLGWSALLLAVLPGGSLAAERLATWMEMGPGTPYAVPSAVLCSPDGRHVAVQVLGDSHPFHRGWVSGEVFATVWVVAVETAHLHVLPGRRWEARGWSDAGDLLVPSIRNQEESPGVVDSRWLDPDTGAFLDTPRVSSEVNERWNSYPSWARTEHTDTTQTIVWKERDLRERIDTEGGYTVVQHVPGCVLLHTAAGGLERIDLGRGRRTLVESGLKPSFDFDAVSFDDRYLIVYYQGASLLESSAAVLDAHDGALIAGPWPDSSITWMDPEVSDGVVLVAKLTGRLDRECRLHDLETGKEIELGLLAMARAYHGAGVQRLPDGRLVVLRPDGAVELLASDGSHVRVLVAP